jgi:hypothetical protein
LVLTGQCGLLKTPGRSASEVPEERMLQQERNQRRPVINVRRARFVRVSEFVGSRPSGPFQIKMPGQPNYRAVSRFGDLT